MKKITNVCLKPIDSKLVHETLVETKFFRGVTYVNLSTVKILVNFKDQLNNYMSYLMITPRHDN